MADHCHVCDAIKSDPPERVLLRDEYWYAGAAGDPPGWVRFQTNRHGDWAWDLTDEEAASYGPTVRKLSAAVKSATGADKVYIVAFGDNSMHFHMLLMPCSADTPDDWRGGALISHYAELGDAPEALRINDAIRAHLGT